LKKSRHPFTAVSVVVCVLLEKNGEMANCNLNPDRFHFVEFGITGNLPDAVFK
jgi:hypothetical protein